MDCQYFKVLFHIFEETRGLVNVKWHPLSQVRAAENVPVILVGNKVDLEASGQRRVSPEEGADLANKFGCKFLETSAAHRRHVDEVFHTLVRDIRSRQVGFVEETRKRTSS